MGMTHCPATIVVMDETYMTNAAWLRTAGRIDHIDDSFERPAPAWPTARSDGWTSLVARWPRAPRRAA